MRAAGRLATPVAAALTMTLAVAAAALAASNPETDKSLGPSERKTFSIFAFQAITVFVKKG